MVLDLGSGEKPFWRADVYVDDLSMGNMQRATNKPVITKFGLFVDARAEALPFKDESFDYVYCSHLLEHVEAPDKVANEIQRVLKSNGVAYLDLPNALNDMVIQHIAHLWLVFDSGEGFVFYRKSKALFTAIDTNGQIYRRFTRHCLRENHFIRKQLRKPFKLTVINDINSENLYYPPKAEITITKTQRLDVLPLINKVFRWLFVKEKDYSEIFIK